MKRTFSRAVVRLLAALTVAWALCVAAPSRAHEATPGVVALNEVSPGRFRMLWSPPSPPIDDLTVRLPGSCQYRGKPLVELGAARGGGPLLVDCGEGGLTGELEFASTAASPGRIAVNVEWLDGAHTLLLSSGSPASVSVRGPARAGGPWQVIRQYLRLGVEHIWFGVDHLLFVLGLLLLVRGWKRTLMTVTAFTIAHSLTLALATLDLVSVATAPIEICIALSVLLLAVENTRGPDTFTHRFPWLVAFAFGLLHGLGFASALSEVGLPPDATPLALLGFNLGVELGQIAIVGAVVLGHRLLRPRPRLETIIARAAVWLLGTCSAYWLLERVTVWLEGLGVLG